MTAILRTSLPLFTMLLTLCSFIQACTDDEEILPDYRTETADLLTDAEGRGTHIMLDNGNTFAVSNPPTSLPHDTIYRVMVLFTQGNDRVRLSDYSPVLTPHAAKFGAEQIKYHPVKFAALSRAANYINLRLHVIGSAQGVHYFGMNQTDFIKHPDGSRTLCVKLIHDRNGDPEYFTRNTYISLPLRPLDHLLTAGRDSVRVSVQLYEGETVRTFAF